MPYMDAYTPDNSSGEINPVIRSAEIALEVNSSHDPGGVQR